MSGHWPQFKWLYCVFLACFCAFTLIACTDQPLNNPYVDLQSSEKVIYSSFSERPKHLDPARAYSSNEYAILSQIYEPLFQYHYLKRPYQLEPLTAAKMPMVRYFDAKGKPLSEDAQANEIVFSEYHLTIKSGVQFQPHPAFNLALHDMLPTEWGGESINTLSANTRVLTSEDYVYQIKRLADPATQSPIAGLMKNYIIGFSEFMQQQKVLIKNKTTQTKSQRLRSMAMTGLTIVDDQNFIIKIKGKYPQFVNWLAMPFFAPMPWEADAFYNNPVLISKNMTLDWYPVGTGPFWLEENNPNRRMILANNPNFREELYPHEGAIGDAEKGLLQDAGKRLPLSDTVIFSLEKESIPYWNKFLQGYYDGSGISSDSFDQAVSFTSAGGVELTSALAERAIKLQTAVTTSSYYLGFNMLDKTVGGLSDKAKKLRQAISIAVDYEEYISIFQNGRGVPAQGAIPPGIFGHLEGAKGINPVVYTWNKRPVRRSIEEAKILLSEAGFANGLNQKTGDPLVLYFDTMDSGPDSKARLNWLRKQFDKLNIQLVIRATDYNRFQEKMRNGNSQMFMWGWNADYPDPENFLFLLYGGNAKAVYSGENAANYQNAEFDRLFESMNTMENSPQRQRIINEMTELLREDAPWLWGFHPKAFSLHHSWYKNTNPNLMANNKVKYINVDPQQREEYRKKWNSPVLWPVAGIVLLLLLLIIPAIVLYRRINNKAAR